MNQTTKLTKKANQVRWRTLILGETQMIGTALRASRSCAHRSDLLGGKLRRARRYAAANEVGNARASDRCSNSGQCFQCLASERAFAHRFGNSPVCAKDKQDWRRFDQIIIEEQCGIATGATQSIHKAEGFSMSARLPEQLAKYGISIAYY